MILSFRKTDMIHNIKRREQTCSRLSTEKSDTLRYYLASLFSGETISSNSTSKIRTALFGIAGDGL